MLHGENSNFWLNFDRLIMHDPYDKGTDSWADRGLGHLEAHKGAKTFIFLTSLRKLLTKLSIRVP